MDAFRDYWTLLSSNAKTAIVLAVCGQFLSFSEFAQSNINGVYDCYYYDYAAILFGAAAILFAVLTVFQAMRLDSPKPNERVINSAVAGFAILAGIYHIVRGLGIVGSPCLL